MTSARGGLVWDRDGLDWPNRQASRFIEAAGLTWHIQQMGSGPAALLLHGTAAATHSWERIMPMLAERFAITAPDLPGHGFTKSIPSSEMSLDGIGAKLAALLKTLAVKPDLVIGHSAGAAIAARLALDGSIAPRLIISLNGALMPFPGAAGQLFPAMAKLLFLNPLTPQIFAWRARDIKAVERVIASTGSHLPLDGLALYHRLFRASGHVGAALAMMANWDLASLAKRLPDLPCPLVLLVGGNDRAVSPDQAFRLAKIIPGAKAELLRGLGHLMHEEEPRRVADVIFQADASLAAEAAP